MINVPDQSGLVLFILTSVLMSLAILPVAMTRVVAPELPKPQRFEFGRLWGTSPTGMTASMAAGSMMGAFYGLGALFAQQTGLDKAATAEFMGAVIIGGLLLQWPIGKVSDKVDRRIVVAAVTVGTVAVCAAMIGKDASHGRGLLLLGAMFGGLSFTIYPLAVAYTNDFLDPEDLVPASGGLILAYGIGAALGPVIGSVAMGALGPDGLFYYIGGVGILLAVFIVYRITQRGTIDVAEQGDFQAMQRTTAVVYELHPDAEVEEEPEKAEEAQTPPAPSP